MASLRARILAGVLVLSAAGLTLLAVVTYAEESSFLNSRIDREVEKAVPAVSEALDSAGFRPHSEGLGFSPVAGSNFGAGPGGGPPNLHLPPGTYGQRREADGVVLGHLLVSYGQSAPAAPSIPAHVPVGKLVTLGSVGSSGLHYRAYLAHDPEDSGLTLVAVPLNEVGGTLSRLRNVEILVIVGVLAALTVTALFVVRLGLRLLDRMQATAGAIAAGELSRRVSPATTKTEVGRLGLALNAMLERLEEAFAQRTASEERLRHFIADASHELRTPLASIRGYAELFRMGAASDTAEIERAMGRIEDESKRMGVLVEDLLTLARLDQAPVREHVQVDMGALASDAVKDARVRAPDREITISSAAPAVVAGDADQLRQVLANLLGNALVHTPAGTPIEVEVVGDAAMVTISVRDHGAGLPGDAAEQLFERFWRAEGGRERGNAGAGLGLAIVAGVVHAHNGDIKAENAPGGGAVFTVRLPTAAATGPVGPVATGDRGVAT